jgi:hypothetical protein
VSDNWLSSWWPGYAEVVGAPDFESRLLGDGATVRSDRHWRPIPAYAAQVRAIHEAKRNLTKVFDSQGW